MNRIKYFWDLSACTSYQSHWIDQFAAGITTGGGYFKWVEASNVGITNIPGIRIKPTGTTAGYWLRDIVDGIYVDWCGPTHSNVTISSLGISQGTADTYWGSGVTVVASDTPDVAAINAAFDAAVTLGIHNVNFNGGAYYVNKSSQIDKAVDLEYHWTVDGKGSEINTTNNNTFSVFKTQLPTDNGEAQQMVSSRHAVRNFKFICQSNQIALDFGPSYSSEFSNILVENGNIGLRLRFALAATITGLRTMDCAYGARLESGQDAYSVTTYWTGATTSNSQCNHSNFKGCRFYQNGTGTIAIDLRDASGINIVDCIIEGARWAKGVSLYSQLTTVYTCSIKNIHYECTLGTLTAGNSQALFYVRTLGGTFVINGAYGQYAAVLCDSGLSSGGASINIITENMHYWVPDSGGDMYYNAGNTSYVWINNDNSMLTGASWANSVAGTPVSLCGGAGCGNNTYYFYAIPR